MKNKILEEYIAATSELKQLELLTKGIERRGSLYLGNECYMHYMPVYQIVMQELKQRVDQLNDKINDMLQ